MTYSRAVVFHFAKRAKLAVHVTSLHRKTEIVRFRPRCIHVVTGGIEKKFRITSDHWLSVFQR